MTIDDLTRDVAAYTGDYDAGLEPCATGIDGLSVVRTTNPTALAPVVYQPLLCLVLQGAKQAFLGETPVTFRRGQSLIVSLDLPTTGWIIEASASAPYLAIALRLDLGLVRELADEIDETALREEEGLAIATGAADAALFDAVARLFALRGRPTAARVLEPLVRREIHYLLLTVAHGAMLRDLARADSQVSRIANAVAAIRRDYAEPLRVTDLARLTGMSPSAFHDHFRRVTATTPLQFQKQLRLMEARRLLISGEQGVAGAAYAVGYESPTQFSREYRRVFGVSPRSDMSRAAAGEPLAT